MPKNVNRSVGRLLRSSNNLQHLVGADKHTAIKLAIENDICCGLGRKTIYFAKAGGTPTTIKKYPFTFNNTLVNDKIEFEEALTNYFGSGYIVYVVNVGNAVVLAAPYKKTEDGTLPIADFVVIN